MLLMEALDRPDTRVVANAILAPSQSAETAEQDAFS